MHELARHYTTTAHRSYTDRLRTKRAWRSLADHLGEIAAACRTAPQGRQVVAWLYADGTWGGVSVPLVVGGISRVTVPKGAFVVYLAADPQATTTSVIDQLTRRRLQSLAALAAATVAS